MKDVAAMFWLVAPGLLLALVELGELERLSFIWLAEPRHVADVWRKGEFGNV